MAANENWQPLFTNNDLSDFTQLGGEATYHIDGDTIVGTSVANSPNSFLTTNSIYSDFILEYDIWIDNRINSGVQIRSQSIPSYQNGRVHGYQVEADPSVRAYTGGIYDEGRRKWLYPLSVNPAASEAFRNGSWNSIRVEAIGNHIRTWVNGVMASRLVDAMDAKGFIALQVHSIKDPSLAGALVKWRGLRIMTRDLEANRWAASPNVPEISMLVNQLTEKEKRLGYKLLFDGKTNKGWKSAKLSEFPKTGWLIKDGLLTIQATNGEESAGPGDIITEQKYSNFEFELEFKITEGANSGIKYFVDPELNKGPGSAIGLEFQILDDNNHPDAKKGVLGNRTVGSAYDLIAAKNLIHPGQAKRKLFNGVGQWNKARILVNDGKVEHWLNNIKVVEFDRHSQIFQALVNYSKYKDWPSFGQLPEGNILLQDHGNTVHFRSIKIREF